VLAARDVAERIPGLDVVARRDIAPGEAITLDYATYSDEIMTPFECECGSPLCRKLIRGTDFLEDWVAERYGDHLSPHLLLRRSKRG